MDGLTFQDIIMRLDAYWAGQGCLVAQPYDMEVGAATNAPGTFLRVLGPEPWNVAYAQASRRPDDGRYAENPNRYQHYFQHQVILKPAPKDPIGLYMESLAAIGVSDRDHDVRFVEDNWEAPSLGAWGLGWEVWLDGLEITQFTYFQQAGNLDLNPPSVEITYGLERIAMYLQGVRDMADIRWNNRVTYGELYRQSEVEYCTYNFELAEVESLRSMFELYEAEARRAIDARLVAPALDQVLKCSHTFNVLDARGAVGVQQRASYMGRMRALARRVAAVHVEDRERLGFPLLRRSNSAAAEPSPDAPEATESSSGEGADFLLEVGVEELPAGELQSAVGQLSQAAPHALQAAGLTCGDLRVSGTPRRLVLHASEVSIVQTVRDEQVTGPPVASAYDEDGKPTRAAEGFARKQGVTVAKLRRLEIGGRWYVAAVKRVTAPALPELLAEVAGSLLRGLHFGRSMYWERPEIVFSRPVRWILALWGEQLVPVSFAGVVAGRHTYGPRGGDRAPVRVTSVGEYAAQVRGLGVVLDIEERRSAILAESDALAASVGGNIERDPVLLSEVANLVEWPTPLMGSFDPEYLEIPSVALAMVMKKHQRYFPVQGQDRQLLPHFVAIANGRRERLDEIRRGNEDVLRARFADALYFYRQDLTRPLEEFVADLARLTFLQGVGSMLDKADRLTALSGEVANELGNGADRQQLARAARLAKADLATGLVRELTDLQGEMGREYALRGGESDDVAAAIAEHYQPRAPGASMPVSQLGIVLAVADRLDTLVTGFAAGLEPTGSSDPYGLRRQGLAVIGILIQQRNPAGLERLIGLASARSPIPLTDDRRERLGEFLRQRLEGLLQAEHGLRLEAIDAVLARQADQPGLAATTAGALAAAMETPDFQRLMAGLKRADRIVPRDARLPLRPEVLIEDADLTLLAAYRGAAEGVSKLRSDDVNGLIVAMLPLIGPIDRFFAEVMVMVDDRRLREARLALLECIHALPMRSFDVARLPGAGTRS